MALLQNKQCHATVMVKTALKTQWLKEGSFAAAATAAIVWGGYFFLLFAHTTCPKIIAL